MAKYEKDKKNRLTIRLNDSEMAFIFDRAKRLNLSPSAVVRLAILCLMAKEEK